MIQAQLLTQAVLALAERADPSSDRRHMLADGQVDAVTVDGGIAPSTPGSRAGLLPLSPLRTARESFPSSSSSLANAPCGTRLCHGEHLAVAQPSPYVLGASEPSSGRRVHQSVSPLPSSAFSPVEV